MKEIVICAAVRAKDGKVIIGHRHNFAMRTMNVIPGYENERPNGDDQGFITSMNRYVNREEGYKLQIEAGIPSKDPGGYRGGELFSEDLY